MYTAIKQSSSPIIVIGRGIVGSAATILMQAATVRLLTPLTTFLAHEGSLDIEGENKSVSATVRSMRSTVDQCYDIYAGRCKDASFFSDKTDKLVKKWLKTKISKVSDWYMTEEEAVKYGFADGILGWPPHAKIEDVYFSLQQPEWCI